MGGGFRISTDEKGEQLDKRGVLREHSEKMEKSACASGKCQRSSVEKQTALPKSLALRTIGQEENAEKDNAQASEFPGRCAASSNPMISAMHAPHTAWIGISQFEEISRCQAAFQRGSVRQQPYKAPPRIS